MHVGRFGRLGAWHGASIATREYAQGARAMTGTDASTNGSHGYAGQVLSMVCSAVFSGVDTVRA